MKQLADQIVLITGAGGGFGRELTAQFVRAGSHVILTDLHAAALPRSAEAIPHVCGSVLGTVAADLSTPEGCAALVAATHTITPHIDIAGHRSAGYRPESTAQAPPAGSAGTTAPTSIT